MPLDAKFAGNKLLNPKFLVKRSNQDYSDDGSDIPSNAVTTDSLIAITTDALDYVVTG